ncbi:MAG: Ig-like domain-containing protein [Proteobacteria bacterium]|nr:Ig-like domain-containing protein [Pseudomonadota bacterium]
MNARLFRSSLLFALCATATLVGCKKPTEEAPEVERRVGPGLGNLSYAEDELFEPLAFIDSDSGVPSAASVVRLVKPIGTNVAYMHNGYLLTLFASDSGLTGGGLLTYDVSDPRAPELVHTEHQFFANGREEEVEDIPDATVYDGRTGGFREAHSIGFSHLDGRDLAMFHTALGIEIWDLTDMLDPQPVSTLDLPDVQAGDYTNVAWQLSWQGNYAYVASSNQGIFIVDTTDPDAPVLADRDGAPNPVPPGELGGFRIGPLFAVGNQLVVSSMDDRGGYAVLDITEPAHPNLTSALTSGLETFYSICFSGDRIIGSVRGAGAQMTVHDVRDPYVITSVGNRPVIDEQLYCSTQDGFVFQGNEGDFAKVDVRDPQDFHEVGRGSLGRPNADHGQVTPFGNLLFVGNDHGTGSALFPHQAEPDTAPPAVVAVFPRDGSEHVGANTRVGLAFTDAIDNMTLTTDNLELREVGGDVVPGRFAVQGHLVNFAPDAPLSRGSTYEVNAVAGGLHDWSGNAVDADFSSTFTVSPLDGGAPGALAIDLVHPGNVEVSQPVALRADVSGAGTIELAWRFEDSGSWTAFDSATETTHTFSEPGHVNVFVRATDGVQTVVDSARVTVHRPVVGDRALSSATVALDEVRGHAWVANRDNGTVSRVTVDGLVKHDEVAVGDTPSSVAVDGSGTAWVTLEGEDSIATVTSAGVVQVTPLDHGAAPCGVVADPTANAVYVSEFGTGDVVRFDTTTGLETARTPVAQGICGLALGPDGETLWVSELRGSDLGAYVHEVDVNPLTAQTVLTLPVDEQTVDAEDRSRGVPGFLGAPVVSPSGQRAWVPAVQSNILRGHYRDGLTLTHESSVRTVLGELDLAAGTEVSGERIDFNDRAGAIAGVTTSVGDYVFVALMGSNEVAIVDAYSGATAGSVRFVGAAPRSLALSEDGTRLFVHAWLDRQLTVLDVAGVLDGSSFAPAELARVDLVSTEQLTEAALSGKRIFNNASDPRMSMDGYISCASCHLDGSHDGLVWDFTERGEGLRNTTDLRGRAGTAHGPVHWTANFDEIQDFENDIRNGFGGTGFLSDADFETGTRSDPLGDPKAGLSTELDDLAAYVASLDTFPASPFRNPDGSLPTEAVSGESRFFALGCDSCHAGASLTDSGTGLHDVGTLTAASGQRRGETLTGLDTPTLLGLWDGGPWLHDGSAETLTELLVDRNPGDAHGTLSTLGSTELAQLEAYLLALDE